MALLSFRRGQHLGVPVARQGGEAAERPAHRANGGRRARLQATGQPDAVGAAYGHRRQDEQPVGQAPDDEGDHAIGRAEVDAVHRRAGSTEPRELEQHNVHGRDEQDAPTAAGLSCTRGGRRVWHDRRVWQGSAVG
jgi:hypothetical protein